MNQNPISVPLMYSNGYIPAFGKEDDRSNPWVLATQTGYKEFWNNKVQTNISLEQKLDFITKGYALKDVLDLTSIMIMKSTTRKCLKHGVHNVSVIRRAK